jgi:uncharacterized iron-regulated membrane protein
MKLSKLNRDIHRWGSILTALPVLVVIVTGVILQLKKDVAWVQPPSAKGSGAELNLGFAQILDAAKSAPEASIESWDDIDRLDVRPSKGIVKVRAKNRWEVQVDLGTGDVLQTAYRRSDLIESIHDGSFFHELAKLWIFLPSAVVLLVLWVTGVYLFFLPYAVKWKRRAAKRLAE